MNGLRLKSTLALLCVAALGEMFCGFAHAQNDSLNGMWISNVKHGDKTINRKLNFDVVETEKTGEIVLETGRFQFEKTVPQKKLNIQGAFKHEASDGAGVITLTPDDADRRFGRKIFIDVVERPQPDKLRLKFTIVEKTISCSCVLILDSADATFTRAKNAPAAQRNGARPRLHQQVLVAWDEVIVPLFVRGLRAIQAPAADTIAAKR
ncbi:MAG: hypothetical protein WEB58_10170 [Planctomycetaceae bacterium]